MKKLCKFLHKLFHRGVKPNKHLVEQEITGVGFVAAPEYMCQPHNRNTNL